MIYTVTTTLPLSHGGRTQALLRRIKLLDEEFKIPSKFSPLIIMVIILVFIKNTDKKTKLQKIYNSRICMNGYQISNFLKSQKH